MKINIEYYGLIKETIGKDNETINCAKTDLIGLRELLTSEYPSLEDKPFVFAVNEQLENNDYNLKNNDLIALLPPFAGG